MMGSLFHGLFSSIPITIHIFQYVFGKVHPLYEKNNQNVGQLDQLTPKNHVAQMFETCQAAK